MKIKYIIQLFYTPRDINGNVYTFVRLTDTRTGRTMEVRDVPASNARSSPYYLNGCEHVQNYYFCETQLTKREFKWCIKNVNYISSCADVLAQTFHGEIQLAILKSF